MTDIVKSAKDECPNHIDGPKGYAAWHSWAEQKTKTHTQHRCTSCGYWAIWRPRVADEEARNGG